MRGMCRVLFWAFGVETRCCDVAMLRFRRIHGVWGRNRLAAGWEFTRSAHERDLVIYKRTMAIWLISNFDWEVQVWPSWKMKYIR